MGRAAETSAPVGRAQMRTAAALKILGGPGAARTASAWTMSWGWWACRCGMGKCVTAGGLACLRRCASAAAGACSCWLALEAVMHGGDAMTGLGGDELTTRVFRARYPDFELRSVEGVHAVIPRETRASRGQA